MKRRILSAFLVFALLCACLPHLSLSVRAADSGKCGDNLYWTFDRSTGELAITGRGDMTSWSVYTDAPWNSFRDSIRTLSLSENLKSISAYAFYECNNLSHVVIPDSVTRISKFAFEQCDALSYVIIGSGVKSIGEGAFRNNNNLTSVMITAEKFSFDTESSTHLGAPGATTIYAGKGTTAAQYAEKWSYSLIVDVQPGAFYTTAVMWAAGSGITSGTDKTHFSPNSTCTRAQVVTFLWRTKGSPSPRSTNNPFTDVKQTAFYYNAVLWAVENNITSGTGNTTFSPNKGCTRGQVVTFLWRAKGSNSPQSWGNPFKDVNTDAFYYTAVLWAVENGITSGTSKTSFAPGKTCTRGQIVTFLSRAETVSSGTVNPGGLVGVSMPTRDLWRWNQDGANLEQLLMEKGYDVDLQFAANDPDLQTTQIENMIANGAKVLIIAAIDGNALYTVLEQARRNGVKVIAYDRLIMNSRAVSYYATFDNYLVGILQGQYIENALNLWAGGRYNIEFITGDPGDNNINFFYDGAMSVLQKYLDNGTLVCRSGQVSKMDVATEGWSTEYAQNRFERILNTYYYNQALHAVLASNDSTAQGVAYALQSSYNNSIYPVITGQDCDIVSTINIMDGKQAMSVFKDTRDLVAKTVEMVNAILRGNQPPINDTATYDNGTGIIPSYLCAPKVCTRDNIKEILIDSGYYTWDDLLH